MLEESRFMSFSWLKMKASVLCSVSIPNVKSCLFYVVHAWISWFECNKVVTVSIPSVSSRLRYLERLLKWPFDSCSHLPCSLKDMKQNLQLKKFLASSPCLKIHFLLVIACRCRITWQLKPQNELPTHTSLTHSSLSILHVWIYWHYVTVAAFVLINAVFRNIASGFSLFLTFRPVEPLPSQFLSSCF